jgi:hypothetical protein
MEKKFYELKLNEIEAVTGGATYATYSVSANLSMSGSVLRTGTSTTLSQPSKLI